MAKTQTWFYVLGCFDSIAAAQLHDLMQLKQENSYLTTIARQISPYILSIAKVKERLEPRSCSHAAYFAPSKTRWSKESPDKFVPFDNSLNNIKFTH